jgi:hypothetical protein
MAASKGIVGVGGLVVAPLAILTILTRIINVKCVGSLGILPSGARSASTRISLALIDQPMLEPHHAILIQRGIPIVPPQITSLGIWTN